MIKTWERSLRYRTVTSWREWLVTPFTYRSVVVLWDVPLVTNIVLRVTLTRATGCAVCGRVLPGRQVYLGETQFGAENDATSFARITTDDDGYTKLRRGRSVAQTRQNVRFLKDRSARLVEARRDLDGRIAFYSALDDANDGFFEPLQLVGYCTQFQLTLAPDSPDHGMLALALKEL